MRLRSRPLAAKLITLALRGRGGLLTWADLLELLDQRSITAEDWDTLAPHFGEGVLVECVPGEQVRATFPGDQRARVAQARERVSQAKEVYSCWAELADQSWREASDHDLSQIGERLREGWSSEDLMDAARSAWASGWHRDKGQTTITAIYRSSDKVTEHLSRWRSKRQGQAELEKARAATRRRRG